MTTTPEQPEPNDAPVAANTTAPVDPFDELQGLFLFAMEATDDAARKAEAAGVLYGEPLYRELSIALAAVRDPLMGMRHAAHLARYQRDNRIAELLGAVDEWAEDNRRTTGILETLTTRVEELEAELEAAAPEPLGQPSERALGLIGILHTMTLNPDEAAYIAAALRNPAAPPASPEQSRPADPGPTAHEAGQ